MTNKTISPTHRKKNKKEMKHDPHPNKLWMNPVLNKFTFKIIILKQDKIKSEEKLGEKNYCEKFDEQ